MNILTAINNEKIFKELKNKKNLKIISNDIQYKEGLLEILEKNKEFDFVIINENISGQIKIEELIKKIKKINSKINIIIILNQKDLIKEDYLSKNKIKFIYSEKLSAEKIINKIYDKNKIISITGSDGCGKTITTIILCELIIKCKNKKILIVEDNIKNNSILKIYENNLKLKGNKEPIIKLKENLDLLNIKKILNNNKRIINEINKIKNNYDYIFIDTQNINSYKIYEEVIEDTILILNSNILEINKIKKFITKNSQQIKLIINNYNQNSISEEILKNIFKNKIKIVGKIENNTSYNLIINNNFDIKYLDYKTKEKFLKIIEKIK